MQAHQKFKHIKKNQAVKNLDASKIHLGVSKIELDALKIELDASKNRVMRVKNRYARNVRQAHHLADSLNPPLHNYERESKVLLLSKNQLMFN